jgi:hypothetical protein
LNENWFVDLADARTKIEAWRIVDLEYRPQSGLRAHKVVDGHRK